MIKIHKLENNCTVKIKGNKIRFYLLGPHHRHVSGFGGNMRNAPSHKFISMQWVYFVQEITNFQDTMEIPLIL